MQTSMSSQPKTVIKAFRDGGPACAPDKTVNLVNSVSGTSGFPLSAHSSLPRGDFATWFSKGSFSVPLPPIRMPEPHTRHRLQKVNSSQGLFSPSVVEEMFSPTKGKVLGCRGSLPGPHITSWKTMFSLLTWRPARVQRSV